MQWNSPFEGLRTLNDHIRALQLHYNYIELQEIPLGYIIDNVLERDGATYAPKTVLETFQYVSIIDILKLVISNKNIRDAVESQSSPSETELKSFVDGDNFKSHPLFQAFPKAIRIFFYHDELEIVNPLLGSKAGVHKIGAFSVKFQNIPDQANSDLPSIHALIVCKYEDSKMCGFANILEPFLHDLDLLESEFGVETFVHEVKYVLHGTVTQFCGDTLAVMEVFKNVVDLKKSCNFVQGSKIIV